MIRYVNAVNVQADTPRRKNTVENEVVVTECIPAISIDVDDDHVTTESSSSVRRLADDPDVLTTDSLTLPRIEQVLRSEGVQPLSITQQINSLRNKVAR